MLDNDFVLGQLVSGVDNLNKQIASLTMELTGLRRDIEEIKLFRAKVVGASMVVSIVSSGLFHIAIIMADKWGK